MYKTSRQGLDIVIGHQTSEISSAHDPITNRVTQTAQHELFQLTKKQAKKSVRFTEPAPLGWLTWGLGFNVS